MYFDLVIPFKAVYPLLLIASILMLIHVSIDEDEKKPCPINVFEPINVPIDETEKKSAPTNVSDPKMYSIKKMKRNLGL